MANPEQVWMAVEWMWLCFTKSCEREETLLVCADLQICKEWQICTLMNSLSLFFYCVFSILLYNNRNCMCEVCEEFFSAQRSGETVTQPKEVGKCFSAQRRKIRTYCPERSALSLLLRHWERQFKKFHRIGPWAPINLCAPLLPRLQLLREDIQLKAAFF